MDNRKEQRRSQHALFSLYFGVVLCLSCPYVNDKNAIWIKKTNKQKKQKQKTIKQLNIKKRSRFSKQNNNFAPVSQFLVHCFAVTVRGLPREIAFRNFTIEGGRKKTTTNFPFSFSVNLESGSKNPSAGEFA